MSHTGGRARLRSQLMRRWIGAAAIVVVATSGAVASPVVGAPAAPDQTTPALVVDVVDIVGPDGQGFVPVEINLRGQVSGFVPDEGFGTGPPLLWEAGEVHQIGSGAGGVPNALNAWGEVAGAVTDPTGTTSAFRWRAGRYAAVPDAVAVDVNELGQVLRAERTAAGGVDLVIDGPLGEIHVPVPGGAMTSPVGITNDGRVIGNAYDPADGGTAAFSWSRRGGTTEIGAPGVQSVTATAVNDAGDVIGRAITEAGHEFAFLWRDGELTDLGSLYGGYTTVVRGIRSHPDLVVHASNRKMINDRGQVIGTSALGEPATERGFVWDDGVMTDLGDLGNGCGGVSPVAINVWGQVVGTCGLNVFLWERGRMHDLGSVFDVGVPVDIDDRGRIVTFGPQSEGSPTLIGHLVTVRR